MAPASFLLSLSTIFLIFFFHLPSSVDAAGFSVDLIHRDSPRSPFYNSADTLSGRVSRGIRRSNSRENYFTSAASAASPNDISSKVLPNDGEYLMTIYLGTPPVEILAIADTGSDLIWTQCSPCDSCYKQEEPLFNPAESSTYRDLSCSSDLCGALQSYDCNTNNSCSYSYSYGDNSYTNGVLAAETLTMNFSSTGSVQIPKIAFGCGHKNDGTFNSKGAGLVGLGAGKLSLISQLGSSVSQKFAYCLVPYDQKTDSSRLDFGDSASVSGIGTVVTPLISKASIADTFYFLSLEKITISNKSIPVPQAYEGNIIIDSGTTLTYLPTAVYKELYSAIKESITDAEPAKDPSNTLELCYKYDESFKAPDLTFGFNGADVVLGSSNTFIQVDDHVICAAFFKTDSVPIFGNVAQQNFKIGYDLGAKKLAFQPTDCAK